jgi:hypothetical protein
MAAKPAKAGGFKKNLLHATVHIKHFKKLLKAPGTFCFLLELLYWESSTINKSKL